jgi:hypothetical protein
MSFKNNLSRTQLYIIIDNTLYFYYTFLFLFTFRKKKIVFSF